MEIRSRSIRLLSSMVLLMAVMRVSTSRRDRQSSFSSAASGVLQSHAVTFRAHFNIECTLWDSNDKANVWSCLLLSCVTLGQAASDVSPHSPDNLLQLGHHNFVTFLSFAQTSCPLIEFENLFLLTRVTLLITGRALSTRCSPVLSGPRWSWWSCPAPLSTASAPPAWPRRRGERGSPGPAPWSLPLPACWSWASHTGPRLWTEPDNQSGLVQCQAVTIWPLVTGRGRCAGGSPGHSPASSGCASAPRSCRWPPPSPWGRPAGWRWSCPGRWWSASASGWSHDTWLSRPGEFWHKDQS